MPERVLITGAQAAAALEIARSFAAAGLEVHMADCTDACLARWSRAAVAVHSYAPPRRHPTRFARDIARLCDRLAPVLIVPACEEVFHLAASAAHGSLDGRLFAPPLDVLARLHSKATFARDCAALGLPVPETVRVTTKDALAPFRTESEAWVFKPEFSRFGAGVLVGPPPERLGSLAPSDEAAWVAQRRIAGDEASFYAVAVEGRVVAFSAYRSDWRLPGGAAYAFDPVAPDLAERLRAMAETLAAKRVGRGQFACDLIVDAHGDPWLIECNPRAVSGVHLFSPGPSLALAMLARIEDAGPARQLSQLGPAFWRYGLPEAMKNGRLEGWNRRRAAGRDVLSAPGDLAPAVGALVDTAAFAVRAALRGLTLEEAMTWDIEWNGEPL